MGRRKCHTLQKATVGYPVEEKDAASKAEKDD